MDPIEEIQRSQPILTGGNAQELVLGVPRRPPIGNRRAGGDHPRPPPRGDPPPIGQQMTESGSTDPITQGFDRIMERFDRLEVRVDNLALQRSKDIDFDDDEWDGDDREYVEYREFDGGHGITNPRHRLPGFSDRRGARGGRRGYHARRDDAWRRAEWQQDGVHDDRLVPYQPRRPSSWDPPAARQRGWRDQRRRGTCWDPPRARERAQYTHWMETNKGKSWDDFLLAVEQRFDPEFYKPYVATGRDQRKPNSKTACLVANQELDYQPQQHKEEVTQVSVNQFGVLPVTVTVSSNSFANESGSNSIICDGNMGMNTLYVDMVTKEHNGCNRDCISVDINPIDDSLIDQACCKALNINNGVIADEDIEEQALVETDFRIEFLDSVNPQSEVPPDSQEEAAIKGVSTDLTGRSNVPAMIFDSYVISHLCEKDEEDVPAKWDPGESICTPRLIADVSDEKEHEHLRSWGGINNKLYIEGNTTRQVVHYVAAPNDGKVVPDAAFSRDAIADDVVLHSLESTQSRGVPAALESLSKLGTIAMYVTDDGGGGDFTKMVDSRMTDLELPHQEIQDSVTGELERGVRCSPAINRAHGASLCIQKLGCYVLPVVLLEDLYDDGRAFMGHTIFPLVASPVRNSFHEDFAEEERLEGSTFVPGRVGHIPCIVTYYTRVSPRVNIIGAKTFESSTVATLGLFYDRRKTREIAGWNISMTFTEWRHAALRFGLVEGAHIFDPGACHGVKLILVTFGGFESGKSWFSLKYFKPDADDKFRKCTAIPSFLSGGILHCVVFELVEAGAAAWCLVMLSRRVGNIPTFAAGEVDLDVVACGGCKIFCGNSGDLVAKPPFIETKVSELDECVANFDEAKEPSVENGVKFRVCDNSGIKLYWGGDPMELPTFLDEEIYVSIRERGELLVELRKSLTRAQQRMTASANKHRRHVEFEVGDFVWLKLQPYCQHSVAKPVSAKLAKRFYGPFEIVQRIGAAAYKLGLPEGSRIHDVLHVSLLRACVKDDPVVPLPDNFVGNRPVAYPIAILDSKILWHNGAAVEHVLVRWSDGSDSPSWEPLADMLKQYPNLSLEDKEASKDGGVVTNSNDTTTPRESPTGDMGNSPLIQPSSSTSNVEEMTTHAEDSTATEELEEQQHNDHNSETERSARPRRQIKPPGRYHDFVAK